MEKKYNRNRTIRIENLNQKTLSKKLIFQIKKDQLPLNKTICWNSIDLLKNLPSNSIDLIFADPPYNLTKHYAWKTFSATTNSKYEKRLKSWMPELKRVLKDNGSIYICCDRKSSVPIFNIMSKYFTIQNRITREREKWRWAMGNWKNCIEDIYFWVKNPKKYTFNIDAVKIKKKVIAPYKTETWIAKDRTEEKNWKFRLTMPSNIWTDISIPFRSMPENTTHPTQKPEKLLAKIILASSNESDVILDPFLWSWTTSVVAKKLKRNYIGIEEQLEYAVISEYRLDLANNDKNIQGYFDWVFWERNTLQARKDISKVSDKQYKKDQSISHLSSNNS